MSLWEFVGALVSQEAVLAVEREYNEQNKIPAIIMRDIKIFFILLTLMCIQVKLILVYPPWGDTVNNHYTGC